VGAHKIGAFEVGIICEYRASEVGSMEVKGPIFSLPMSPGASSNHRQNRLHVGSKPWWEPIGWRRLTCTRYYRLLRVLPFCSPRQDILYSGGE
jgi:hypothetical protein